MRVAPYLTLFPQIKIKHMFKAKLAV